MYRCADASSLCIESGGRWSNWLLLQYIRLFLKYMHTALQYVSSYQKHVCKGGQDQRSMQVTGRTFLNGIERITLTVLEKD